MTTIRWDNNTAYDFFISLLVLHRGAEFGLRPAWTAGVRQRISPPRREALERIYAFCGIPAAWIAAHPAPRSAAGALQSLAGMAPLERFTCLCLPPDLSPDVAHRLMEIAARRSWDAGDQSFLQAGYRPHREPLKPSVIHSLLKAWADAETSGGLLLDALQEYYAVFFAEEEQRLIPDLGEGLARAREMGSRMALPELVEELSRGVQIESLDGLDEITLAPSFWISPLVYLSRPSAGKAVLVYGVRPEVREVAPGAAAAPPLVGALKALADPTRLGILRHLNETPLTPAELARRLRLRPPTVVHHLRLLRLAGLVQVRVGGNNERRYAPRLDNLDEVFSNLKDHLARQD
ncbi:MAG: winged helix-turn-helix transcriptional regulator [Chloroflexi bacterium]|nr:winged helix-turn-helix transcriptional regulator [Chloroflexota bacterium]